MRRLTTHRIGASIVALESVGDLRDVVLVLINAIQETFDRIDNDSAGICRVESGDG